jgi:ribosomal protein S18 acetylase RimI-like enzyme
VAPDRVEWLDAAELTPDVVALLLTAAGPGATPALATEPYLNGATLLAARRCDVVVGVLGLDAPHGSTAAVRALAVDPHHRFAGIGRALIHAARGPTVLTLIAETGSEAVGFYRACGFEVADLGERYPGVRRFRCVLPRAAAGQGPRSHSSR